MNETELEENIEHLYDRYITAKPYDRIDGEDITVGRTLASINELDDADKRDYYANIIHELANVPDGITPEDLDGKLPQLWDKTVKTLLTSDVTNLVSNIDKTTGNQLDSYIWLFNNFSDISEQMSFRIPLIIQMHEAGHDNELKVINQYYIDATEANDDDNNNVHKPSNVSAFEASPDAQTYVNLRDIMESDNNVIIQMIKESGADNPNWRYNAKIRDKVQHTIALARYLASAIKDASTPNQNDIQTAIEYIKEDVYDHAEKHFDEDGNEVKISYPSEKTVERLRDGFITGNVVKLVLDFSDAANQLDDDYKEALETDLGINLIKEVIEETLKYVNDYPPEFVAQILIQQIDDKETIIGNEE